MPRPENPELKERIIAEARTLFREKGYRATSYADVARAAGIAKGLLQYYFPRKEQLAWALMAQVLENARAALGYRERPARGSAEAFCQLYRIGQLFFGYLLGPGGYARFLQDVTTDLDLVETVLDFDLGWALDYAQIGERTGERDIVDTVVMAMGGFYALLHYSLANGLKMDVRARLRVVMRAFMCAAGFSPGEADAALGTTEFDDAGYARALAKM